MDKLILSLLLQFVMPPADQDIPKLSPEPKCFAQQTSFQGPDTRPPSLSLRRSESGSNWFDGDTFTTPYLRIYVNASDDNTWRFANVMRAEMWVNGTKADYATPLPGKPLPRNFTLETYSYGIAKGQLLKVSIYVWDDTGKCSSKTITVSRK